MGVFSKLLAPFRSKRIVDPVFGELLFMGKTCQYWEGTCRFSPTGNEIEVFVDAGEEGPGEYQHSFYRLVESKFSEVLRSLRPALEEEYRIWMEEDLLHPFDSEFTLSSLSIPSGMEQPVRWEVTFDCQSDPEHLFTVAMIDWSPESVTVDG